MKKLILTLTSIILASSVSGQITLTHNMHTPSIGDRYTVIEIESPTLNVSHNGPNQNWDFSNHVSGDELVTEVVDVAIGQHSQDFKNSSVALTYSLMDAETYYIINSSELLIEGNIIPGIGKEVYDQPLKLLEFPLEYGDKISEFYSGEFENIMMEQTFTREGTVTIEADGYGSIDLPYATINNVLRVTVTRDYEDIYQNTPVYDYLDTMYFWYDAYNSSQIASYTVMYVEGSKRTPSSSYLSASDISTAIDKEQIEWKEFSFWPNPAQNSLTVNFPENIDINEEVKILNMNGKVLKTFKPLPNNEQQIDVSDLPSGIHLIQYPSARGTQTEKLWIQ